MMPRSLELLEDLIGKESSWVKSNPALTFAAASAVHSPDPKGISFTISVHPPVE